MKKIILATILFAALSSASFAAGNKEEKKLLNQLAETFKNASQVQWTTYANHKSGTFSFNGKPVRACYGTEENEFVGFSIPVNETELPGAAVDNISKKFNGWKITNSIMFIDAAAHVKYFVQVNKGDRSFALDVTNGRAMIYGQIPEQ